jgi:hypothetical protein
VAVGGARLPSLLQEWHAARPRPRSRKRNRPRSGSGTEALCLRTRTQSSRSNAFPESHRGPNTGPSCSRHTGVYKGSLAESPYFLVSSAAAATAAAAVQPGTCANANADVVQREPEPEPRADSRLRLPEVRGRAGLPGRRRFM